MNSILKPPDDYTKNYKLFIENKKNNDRYLASIIILYRKSNDNEREKNLNFMLNWIYNYFRNIFEVIIIEQDNRKKLNIDSKYNFKYYFLYNNKDFNRGWGFNCAVRHYSTTDVVCLIDNDIILNKSFFEMVLEIYKEYYICGSPYRYVYFSESIEKRKILNGNYNIVKTLNNVQYPVTICGGIFIIRKKEFLDIGGYEEYKGYGCEDRALDVVILELFKNKIKINNEIYLHLYHNKTKDKDKNLNLIRNHLKKYYKCGIKNCKNKYNIHNECNHQDIKIIEKIIAFKKKYIGNINLYKIDFYNTINSIPNYNF